MGDNNSNADLFTEEKDNSILAGFAWWEKRRIPYNIVIGICGVLSLISIREPLDLPLVMAIVAYALFANLFYTIGFLIEVVSRYYFKSGRDFTSIREGLFWFGLVISVGITVGLVSIMVLLAW